MKTSKHVIISNLIWRFAERAGAQIVSFVVSIVLARLLVPEVYGTVALVTVFISFFQIFVDSGLGNSLIQKENVDEIDFSTVFYVNVLGCLFLYLILFLCAPLIANFYNNLELISLTRVTGLFLIISGLKNIQQAYVSKNLLFKKFFYSTIGGTIISAVVGITMALKGFGAWALVCQQLSNLFIDTCILWFTVKWRPRLKFSFSRLKYLYSFGWKLLVTNLMESIYSNLQQLIVGKVYTSADLAFFNRGKSLPNLVMSNIQMSIDSVMFPVLAREQSNKEAMRIIVRKTVKLSLYIIGAILGGMFATADKIVLILYTEKWAFCIPYFRIFCIVMLTCCVNFVNMDVIMAQGRSDISLKIEIIKKVFAFVFLILTVRLGVIYMAYGILASYLLSTIINIFPNKKLIDYGVLKQLRDYIPELLLIIFMTVCVYFVGLLDINLYLIFLIQIVVGIGLYILISFIFSMESFKYLLKILKEKFKK